MFLVNQSTNKVFKYRLSFNSELFEKKVVAAGWQTEVDRRTQKKLQFFRQTRTQNIQMWNSINSRQMDLLCG